MIKGTKYGASKIKPPLKAGKGINLKESRLNMGGDTAWKGKRSSVKKAKGGY